MGCGRFAARNDVGWRDAAHRICRGDAANICSPAAYLVTHARGSEGSCGTGREMGSHCGTLAKLEDANNPGEAEDTEDGGARARKP